MSPPRFLVTKLPPSGSLVLDEAEARHASNVLRLSEGDAVVLFDGVGGEAAATIEQIQKRTVSVSIVARTDTNCELPYALQMLVALPKGDRQRLLVDGLVQLGVAQLTPLETQRGVAQPSEKAVQRLQRTVIESSKQCGRNLLMDIGQPTSVSALAELASQSDMLSILAHPYGNTMHLPREPQTRNCRVAIGPEGGFSDEECDLLVGAGWQPVRLGARILRIEVASLMVAAWWASLSD